MIFSNPGRFAKKTVHGQVHLGSYCFRGVARSLESVQPGKVSPGDDPFKQVRF